MGQGLRAYLSFTSWCLLTTEGIERLLDSEDIYLQSKTSSSHYSAKYFQRRPLISTRYNVSRQERLYSILAHLWGPATPYRMCVPSLQWCQFLSAVCVLSVVCAGAWFRVSPIITANACLSVWASSPLELQTSVCTCPATSTLFFFPDADRCPLNYCAPCGL